MTRQLTILLVAVLSLLIAVILYFTVFSNQTKHIATHQLIPDNAVAIIEIKSPEKNLESIQKLDWFAQIIEQPYLNDILKDYEILDSLLQKTVFKESLKEGEVSISFHPFTNGTIGLFYCVRLLNKIDNISINEFLVSHFKNRFGYNKRIFNGSEIYDYTDFKTGKKISIAITNDFLFATYDGLLTEMALLKYKKANLLEQQNKADFIYHNSNGINVYIYPKYINRFLKLFTSNNTEINFLNTFCDKIELNTSINDKSLKLNGVAITHDTLFQYIDLLNGQAPVTNNVYKYLPDNISSATILNLSNYQIFYTNLNEYLIANNLYNEYKNYADSVNDHLQINIAENLSKYIGKNAALVYVHEPILPYEKSKFAMLDITDEFMVRNSLNKIGNLIDKKYSLDTLDIADTTGDIFKSNLGTYFKWFWGDIFDNLNFNYYTILNNKLYYAENEKVLHIITEKLKTNEKLSEQKEFKKNTENLNETDNFLFIVNGANAYKSLLQTVNKEVHSNMVKNAVYYNKTNYFTLQLSGSTDHYFMVNAYSGFNTSMPQSVEKLWDYTLDTTIIGTPQIVFNSAINGQMVLAQDKQFKIHFYSVDGVLINSIQLNDEVISNIETIDLFKNDKTYYLFNSQKYIYLLDEKGNHAYGWPVWIPTGTNYPVKYFEINNEFAVFAGGLYYKISAFNNTGKLIQGFNPLNIWPNINSSLDEFYWHGNNYLWYLNSAGKPVILNQLANTIKIPLVDSSVNFKCMKIVNVDSMTIHTIASDSLGSYLYRYKSNSCKMLKSNDFVSYNITNKSDKYYVLSNNNSFAITDKNLNIVFKKQYQDSIALVNTYKLQNKDAVLFLNKNLNRLLAVDFKGNSLDEFPFDCTTGYSLKSAFDGNNYFVFANGNKLQLFKLR